MLTLDGKFLTTKDAGQTWSSQDFDFAGYKFVDQNNKSGTLVMSNTAVAEISFTDENNGIVIFIGIVPGAGYQTWSFSTADGGTTWIKEQIKAADDFNPTTLNLSRDGKHLTLSDNKKRVISLERK